MTLILDAPASAGMDGTTLATLVSLAWKSCLVLATAGALAALLRRAAASTRHLVWAAAMVGLLFLPAFAFFLPRQELALLPRVEHSAQSQELAVESGHGRFELPAVHDETGPRQPVFEEDAGLEGDGAAALATDRSPMAAVESRGASSAGALAWPSASSLLLFTWGTGALLVLAPMVIGLFLSRRRRRAGRPAPAPVVAELCSQLGIRKPVRVLRTEASGMPMVCGILHPAVLLPEEAGGWSAAKRRSVLLHELAHVLRRDCQTQLMARVALALFWFNPLAWYANRRMLIERERACDDLVLRSGTRAEDYAENLLDVARGGAAPSLLGTAAVMMARRSQLEGRLLAILDAGRRRSALSRRKLQAGLGLALSAVALLSTVQLTAREALAIESLGGATVVLKDRPGTSALWEVLGQSTLQVAIDAAPAGSTLRIPAGEYSESLRITKNLVLEGSGWSSTRVLGTEASPTALRVEGATNVVLRGLRFGSPGAHKEGSLKPGGIVEIADSVARIEDCVIAGGPANGLVVSGASDVELRASLVAGTWAEGVVVDAPATARLVQCDIRNIYHYGVRIRSGTQVTIEECRISGTGWHAIRYDGAAPTIRGNLLFDNDRFGIYASGKTAATVTHNHFHGNGMAGMAAWKGSADTVENNTFSRNLRSGLEILGASNPRVKRNIFFDNPVGLSNGNVEPAAPWAGTGEGLDFDLNYFWKNRESLRRVLNTPDGPKLDPQADAAFLEQRRSVTVDPIFVNLAGNDYTIAARSAARIENVGALDPLAFDSPWPLQPEEAPFVEKRGHAAVEASAPSRQDAYAAAKPWIDDVMQIRDAAQRARGVEQIRQALASSDEGTRYAGLVAFLGTTEASYDKASFRELILTCTTSSHGAVQERAFYALFNAGPQPGDLERLLAAARANAPGFSGSASHLIFLFSEGNIQGEASAVLLGLMKTDDRRIVRDHLGGLWGARVSPELELRLVELAQTDDRELYHDVIYFALSTLEGKSNAVIEELFKAAEHRDPNNWGRALWGLGFGVPVEHQTKVCDFALSFFEARGSAKARSKAAKLIEAYAGPEHVARIEALAGNELVAKEYRERLGALAKKLQQD